MQETTNGQAIGAAIQQFMPQFIRYINPVIHRIKTAYDFNENQIKVIMAVSLLEPVSPTQLSDALLIQKGSLTTIIRSLIRSGMIIRSTAPDDARRYYLAITAAGRAFIREKKAFDSMRFDTLFADMPPGDLRTVCDGLDTLTRYLEKIGEKDDMRSDPGV